MKRDLVVSVDCNKRTCGKCPWQEHGTHWQVFCTLYLDKDSFICLRTKVDSDRNYRLTVFRCEQCLRGETKP